MAGFTLSRMMLFGWMAAGQAPVGGNGQDGNMFDIAPSVDMTIECVNVHQDTAGTIFNIEVYWCPVTSVGNEQNAGVWTLLGSQTGLVSNGFGATTEVGL